MAIIALFFGLGLMATFVLAQSPISKLADPSDPFFPSRLSAEGGRAVTAKDFEPPEDCGECHDQIHSQWEGGLHANAWKDPAYTALHQLGSKETGGLVDRYCVGCHAPIAVLGGEVKPGQDSQISELAQKGVQCDFCHTISGSKGIGNASSISSPGPIKRGPFKDSESLAHETAYSELHTRAEFCGMCHDVYHPVNGLPLEKTYTEWYEGPYPARGVKCQDCHMTPGITRFQENPGQAAIMGPKRGHIWTHNIVGANASMTALMGFQAHSEMALKRLRSAATLQILTPSGARAGEMTTLRVKVTNVGAGHFLPTGLTESREMWLEVMVTGPDGKKLFHSGRVDEKGEIDPEAVLYHTVFANTKGEPVGARVWEADHLLWDHRIPPLGHALERFSLQLPAGIRGKCRVEARLLYRSFPQSLVNLLFGEKAALWPIHEMNRAEGSFSVD
ncbi:MAG: multiheme c-type cytochrome [candidate division NC10 bacterium]|nr:multiheme c-type cytochrome [candidate division NC10 bacterium]